MAKEFEKLRGIRIKPIEQGTRFNRWTTEGCEFKVRGKSLVVCKCDCGKIAVVGKGHMVSGESQSCGCLAAEQASIKNRTHGATRSTEYCIWAGMISRCHYSRHPAYDDYGGRGVVVCQRWRESFSAFVSDVGPRPSRKHSLDRFPDNNGNYEPNNVRWATQKEQGNNTRVNRHLEINGESKTISQWADCSGVAGVNQDRIWNRLHRGWTDYDAVFTPLNGTRSTITVLGVSKRLCEWTRDTGIAGGTIRRRLIAGWSAEDAVSIPVRKKLNAELQ